jgi:hypothetical protein
MRCVEHGYTRNCQLLASFSRSLPGASGFVAGFDDQRGISMRNSEQRYFNRVHFNFLTPLTLED